MKTVIACVLKSGGDFQPEHVQRLHDQLRGAGQWTGDFVCLSDQPFPFSADSYLWRLKHDFPGWWSKLELCDPGNDILGDLFYFDLDTTIVGSVDGIAAVGRLNSAFHRIIMLDDFLRPGRKGSGLMYLSVEARRKAWAWWQGYGPEYHMRRFGLRGDQRFFETVWADSNVVTFQSLLPGQVVSFKEHVRPSGYIIPWDARVICYHGKPRPWEVDCALR